MKNRIYLIALLLISCLISSCESDEVNNENIAYKTEFQKSESTLYNFKKENNNSYKYTVVSSSWIGILWQTTLIVSNGKVIGRNFKFTKTNGIEIDSPKEELEWTETGSELGSHKEDGAAAVQTLDEIYNKSKSEWLLIREHAKTYFETENNGLISTCGYVENGCQDDCFRGIYIKSIEPLLEE